MAINENGRYNEFKITCKGCGRGMVWVAVGADENHRTVMTISEHKYVVGFGTPQQALVRCNMSGQPYKIG